MNQQTTGGATREAVKEYLQQYHMAPPHAGAPP